ncbi:hypothetical protein FIM12_03130 [SAR202 cluster bacterium AD-804-J14_MRT_500m]|nr:hypothetical protein [SAR202 cluster bacterium AD-804-J14_MRT_500m]
MGNSTELTKKAFFEMAGQLGLDTNDKDHMEEIYFQAQNIMRTVAELREIDVGETEPSNTFSPLRG